MSFSFTFIQVIVLCCYDFLNLLWENIFLVWVTCFPVKEGWKVGQERGHNLKIEGHEVADLFRDTAFDSEWNWKTSKEHQGSLSARNLENYSNSILFLIFQWWIFTGKTKSSYCDPFSVKKNIFPHSVTLFPLRKIFFLTVWRKLWRKNF